MSDLFNKLKKGVSDNLPKDLGNAGALGAAGVGGLVGALFGGSKSVQKVAKNVAVIGGSAALAGLAYKMYQKWSNNGANNNQGQAQGTQNTYNTPQNQGGFGSFGSSGSLNNNDFAQQDDPFADYNAQQQSMQLDNKTTELLLEAMIFAARADGHVDKQEQETILNTARSLSSNNNFNEVIRNSLNKPLDPQSIAQRVSSYEQGLDVYRLSALAIVADNAMERNYLNSLAQALRIDSNTQARLEQEANQLRG